MTRVWTRKIIIILPNCITTHANHAFSDCNATFACRNQRHNLVNNAINKCAIQNRYTTKVEPYVKQYFNPRIAIANDNQLPEDDVRNSRGDLYIFDTSSNKQLLVDVSIVKPITKTHNSVGTNARSMIKTKTKKYTDTFRFNDVKQELKIFAMEHSGYFSDEAISVLKTIARRSAKNNPGNPDAFHTTMKYTFQRIAVANQNR